MKATEPVFPALRIEGARRSDWTGIRWLLAMEHLPSADITTEALELFLVCRDQLGVIAVVGLERWGDVVLLRPLVVTDQYAGRGLGRRMVFAAEDLPTSVKACGIYLLTTQAALFFAHLGFRPINHDEAPSELRSGHHFSASPTHTAVLMVKP